ncbi:alpha/beta fold hydrolase [Sphingobium sp. CR2-8]|uniref:alpha/beta hydrolase n=1 Tax=Sphingobium sp. CR2-8 TaxID=1306534 RepID=UPI002DC04082|nr:alpha/beta fold hydrolase [Sphingobium sp. CR2-8]MEC3910776.1 alpha/beta fold hydrolase [Sphingobium sp. CR2-8]
MNRIRQAALSWTIAAALALTGCAAAMREQIYKANDATVDIAQWTRSPPQPMPVQTADGIMLTGYYWPGEPMDRDVILFFHGRGSNQGIAARYAEHLTGRGDHVIVVSYRGFGGNPGDPTQAALVDDGRRFIAAARKLVGSNARIFLVGHSLGGAVALHVAATEPVAGVITLSTFDTLAQSAPGGMGKLLPDKWNNLDAASKIGAPLVMIHGTADDRVDMDQAAALFAAARHPADWLIAPGAGHNPDMAKLGPLVSEAVEAVDDDALDDYPVALPTGWEVRRK